MGDKSNIEWCDASWNPIAGCSIVSPGCTNCYAMGQAARIQRMTPGTHYAGTTEVANGRPVWTGKIAEAPDHIFTAPLRWRRPRRIFVNSMSDLFHPGVTDAQRDRVFSVMAACPQHIFQILTKRPELMRAYLTDKTVAAHIGVLPNCWLGVSTEDQRRADERIPILLNTPAAVRFISAEPLLGPLALHLFLPFSTPSDVPSLDWVIVGGESGPHARHMAPEWAADIREQCELAGCAYFLKQMSGKAPIPPELERRQYPHEVTM